MLFVDRDVAACAAWTRAAAGHGLVADRVDPDQALAHAEQAGGYGVIVVGLAERGEAWRLIDALIVRYPYSVVVATAARAEPVERHGPPGAQLEIATLLLEPFTAEDLAVALLDAFELVDRRGRHRATSFDRAHILLVEDNEGDADLITDYLQEICGAIVTPATRVDDAARAMSFHSYDFVISDLTLPDARGLDAVRRLQPLAPDAPFLVLTGTDDEELALEAVKQGAQDYLVKGQIDAVSLRRTLSHARERKQTWNRLREQSRHDPLTGAANRAALRERIEATLAKASRRRVAFAVLFIDLDRFKAINDSCGHAAGDIVLCEIAERMRQATRPTDVVARLGGDEFAVFLDDLWPDARPLEVAERILDALARPIAVPGREVTVTASIGLACYPEIAGSVAGSVDEILKAADSAMYVAKGHGRNNIQAYGAVSEAERARRALTAELAHAAERGELSLQFQPQYTIDGQRVVAFEALLRWTRANGSAVPPAEFIPLLEDSGRIVAVGAWVIERACEQLMRWRGEGFTALRVAVNLSARQIADAGLVEQVRGALARHAMPPACLELELTETMLMADIGRATAVLAELRRLGVRIAIDDFGTGYSSLSYLSKFAVDCLKIDRSFIQNVDPHGAGSRDGAMITSAIVTLGHHLGLEVVAEGVETAEQLAFLRQIHCDLVQGYLLGRPVDARQVSLPRPAAAAPARKTGVVPCVGITAA
ncbi:MAG TPA: GGDEF domain-containing response regulator [Kofleriaceae bacterium]